MSDDSQVEEDVHCYRPKINKLVNAFKDITRLRITKHWRYNAPLFDDIDDEISNGSNIYRYCPEPNAKVEHLYYKTNVVEENELE